MDRTDQRRCTVADRGKPRARRRSRRNAHAAARRSASVATRCAIVAMDRAAAVADRQRRSGTPPRRGRRRVENIAVRRTSRLQQAVDRRAARRRFATSRAAGIGGDQWRGYRTHRATHARRLAAHRRVLLRVAIRRRNGGGRLATVSVFPRFADRRTRGARRHRRLGSRMEVGRHPAAAHPPRRSHRVVVARRGAARRTVPRNRRRRGAAAPRRGDRRRTARLARRRFAPAVRGIADAHPAPETRAEILAGSAGAHARVRSSRTRRLRSARASAARTPCAATRADR